MHSMARPLPGDETARCVKTRLRPAVARRLRAFPPKAPAIALTLPPTVIAFIDPVIK